MFILASIYMIIAISAIPCAVFYLWWIWPPKPNISPEALKAMEELGVDGVRMALLRHDLKQGK